MKPLKLKLQGLHSYKKMQEVDFGRLCERGTFGIFGPTGSGKSTILDAITLALFGKVERASRNTQGIINQDADKIFVSFAFELNSPDGSMSYLVERQFKKSGDNTVLSGSCRLVELNPAGETVLADKAKDVDQEVIRILGLTADDFTRAVVLPQGKFAEFLSLQNKDRRLMLQRLFNLQDYGDKLQEKAKRREELVVNAAMGVEREQQGLGDASEAALAAARESYENAALLEAETRQELDRVEKQYDLGKQLWQWQLEHTALVQQQDMLKNQEQAVLEYVRELTAADKAEVLRHLIVENEEVKIQVAAAAEELKCSQEKHAAAQAKELEAKKAYEAAVEDYESRQPALIKRLTQLDEAKVLEGKLSDIKQRGQSTAERLKALQEKINTLQRTLADTKARGERINQDINQVKEQINNISFSPEYRQQVNAAYYTFKDYESIQKRLQDMQDDVKIKQASQKKAMEASAAAESVFMKAAGRVQELAVQLTKAEEACPVLESELKTRKNMLQMTVIHINDLTRLAGQIKETELKIKEIKAGIAALKETRDKDEKIKAEAQQRISDLEKEKLALEREYKDLELENLACFLGKNLIDGVPCPVCGSKDHPAPAAQCEDAALVRLKDRIMEINELIKALEKEYSVVEKECFGKELQLANLDKDYNQLVEFMGVLNKNLTEKRSFLPEAWKSLDVEEIETAFEREMRETETLEEAFINWRDSVEQLKQTAVQAREEYAAAQGAFEAARGKEQALQGIVQELRANLEVLTVEASQKEQELVRLKGSLAMEEIAPVWEKLNEMAKQEQQLVRKKDTLESEVAQTAQIIEKHTAELTRIQLEETAASLEYRQLKQKFEEIRQNLHDLTGGMPTKKLLDETNKELDVLKGQRAKSLRYWEEATRLFQEQETSLASAQANLSNIAKRVQDLEQKLANGLTNQGFNSYQQAKEALRPMEVRRSLREKIDAYHQNLEIIRDKRKQIETALQGRSLSKEEWDSLQVKLAACKEQYGNAMSQKGAAKQTLDELHIKHARWKQLQEELIILRVQGARIKELRRVLSGNAFVEFLAEEHLINVAAMASSRLGDLTKNRYALEVDSDGGFVIRDDGNGGFRRPVSSLSGGETFLVSLSLALALSSQIQLKGRFPLEFFFLDEGFGSLDQELLELVISSLERLQTEKLSIGVISHVQEMRNRMARRLLVTPAQPGGDGSTLSLEIG